MFGEAAHATARPARQILLLQSFDRGNITVDHFTSSFRVELDERTEEPANIVQVVVGPLGSVGASDQAVIDYIRSTFAGRPKPDLIVTVAGPAAVFARKYREQLFPGTPTLLASVDQRYLGDVPLRDDETAVAVLNDFPGLIETIMRLLPQTRHVVMVVGPGQVGQFWHRQLQNDFKPFEGRLTFDWLDHLTVPEALRRCASLPDNSALIYIIFGTDASGAAYADERIFAELHDAANAPIFAAQSPFLGAGIVGGPLLSIDDVSRDAAEMAVRMLNGTPPVNARVPPRLPGQAIFDWRELQRWGIPESRLPSGSIVRYRDPSLWTAYKRAVLSAAAVLAVQSILIIGLLYQRRERQRAERDSRRNLALAADASRREMMSALTGSIGHELGQPLGSIMHNAQALQMMVTANRATPDTIGEILSDIQTQGVRATQIIDRHRTMLRSHQLDAKPIDLQAVVNETLALLAHDMGAREITATVDLPPNRCIVNADQVLLEQVFVNLVMNAMDAMAATPPARRHISISYDVTATDVAVSLRDTGPGVAADFLGTLFTPFVTTKPHGLGIGLTIVRSILHAHGGTISARNHPDGGAIFTVTLPRSERAA